MAATLTSVYPAALLNSVRGTEEETPRTTVRATSLLRVPRNTVEKNHHGQRGSVGNFDVTLSRNFQVHGASLCASRWISVGFSVCFASSVVH